jgi:hypothetical protein
VIFRLLTRLLDSEPDQVLAQGLKYSTCAAQARRAAFAILFQAYHTASTTNSFGLVSCIRFVLTSSSVVRAQFTAFRQRTGRPVRRFCGFMRNIFSGDIARIR